MAGCCASSTECSDHFVKKIRQKFSFFFQNGVIFFINPGPALTLDLFLTRGGERPHLFSVVFFCVRDKRISRKPMT